MKERIGGEREGDFMDNTTVPIKSCIYRPFVYQKNEKKCHILVLLKK